MTQKRFSAKIVLSVIAALLVLCTLSTAVFAEDSYKNYNCAYGQAVPTDKNLKTQIRNYKFSGDEGTFYFMLISKGKKDAKFAVEIYSGTSTNNYKTKIRSFSQKFSDKAGSTPIKITWPFNNTVSGTYYGKCYTYTETEKDGVTTKVIDSSSQALFTVNIDRLGSKTVKLKSLINNARGTKLTWNSVPTADKYNIYRKKSGDKTWTYLTTLRGKNHTSYEDTTAKSGTTYTYTVKCGNGNFVSKYDKKGLTIKHLSMPAFSVEATGSAGNAKLSWKAVNGANGYYIYRKGGNLSNSNWEVVATIKNGKTTSYTDKTATSSDWKYTYTVKAFSGKTVSGYNYNGIDFDYIAAPKIKSVSPYDGGMKIQWSSSNPNINNYRVYRLDGKTWKHLGSTKSKNFLDKTAVSGKTYTYTIKGVSDTNCGAYNSKGVTSKYLAAPKLASTVTFDNNYRSIVKWNAVDGATGYIVYRKVDNAAHWATVATISGKNNTTFYDNCKKKSGQNYKYTVRAFDSKKFQSYFQISATSGVVLEKPKYTVTQTETENNSLALTLSWKAIVGADKYLVYRRLPGATWACLTDSDAGRTYVTDTTYTDTTVENGVTYEYAVRAWTDKGDYSPFIAKTATAIYVPTISDVTVTNTDEENCTTITWDAIDGIDSYNIYRRAKDSDTWEKIANSTEAAYKDDSEGASSTSYFYAVSSVVGELESAKSTEKANFVEVSLAATVNYTEVNEKNVVDGITLEWNCENYTLAKLTKVCEDSDDISLVDNLTSGTTAKDTAVESGKTYIYTIEISVEGKVNGSATVKIRYPYNQLETPVITKVRNATENNLSAIGIKWSQVDNAEEYILERTSDSVEWKAIATISRENSIDGELDFIDTDIGLDISYTYRVKAIASKAGRPESDFSETATFKVNSALAPLYNLKATTLEGEPTTVVITWDSVENASGYIIYRTTTPDDNGSWIEISRKDVVVYPELKDNSLTENGTYFYKVVAVSDEHGTAFSIVDITVTAFADTSEPPTTEPDVSNPDTSEPSTTEPDIGTPDTSEPSTTEPDVSTPDTSEPSRELEKVSFSDISFDEQLKTIKVSFSSIENGTTYMVYRSTNPEDATTWVKILEKPMNTVGFAGTSLNPTDNKIDKNGTYYYIVVATGDGYKDSISISSAINITSFPEEEKELQEITDAEVTAYTPDGSGKKTGKVTFTTIENASKYTLYMSATPDDISTWVLKNSIDYTIPNERKSLEAALPEEAGTYYYILVASADGYKDSVNKLTQSVKIPASAPPMTEL